MNIQIKNLELYTIHNFKRYRHKRTITRNPLILFMTFMVRIIINTPIYKNKYVYMKNKYQGYFKYGLVNLNDL